MKSIPLVEPKGINFSLPEFIPARNLPEVVQGIWKFISEKDPSSLLFRYDDWWQHDGLHFFRKEIGTTDFEKTIMNIEEMKKDMPGDFYVYVGICSPQMEWYLRYYIDEDQGVEGCIDITVPENWASEFKIYIGNQVKTDWKTENAQAYYKRIKS
jgi:hypothetical protein